MSQMDEVKYAYCAQGKKAFCEDFRKFFPNIRMQGIVDTYLSVCFGKIIIDIKLFCHQLKTLYPGEWETKSLSDMVREHYGDDAMVFLDNSLS